MGWTYTHKPPEETMGAFLKRRIDCDNEYGKWEVLDIAIVNLRTAYMAVLHTPKPMGTSYIVAYVFLLDYRKVPDYNVGYKDMDETTGPVATKCPERILRLLTPIDSADYPGSEQSKAYAAEWREKCWGRIKRARERPVLSHGSVLYHVKGLEYERYGIQHYFYVAHIERQRFWYALDAGFFCKIPKVYQDELELVDVPDYTNDLSGYGLTGITIRRPHLSDVAVGPWFVMTNKNSKVQLLFKSDVYPSSSVPLSTCEGEQAHAFEPLPDITAA